MSGRTPARPRPERTCVGCRERAAKTDLLRIVAVGDDCVPDDRGTLPGRGAYVHPVLVCLDLAVRRRAFPRAFRGRGPLDTSALRRRMEQTKQQVL
ncbi:YlxR family protein [Streptomyces sp. NPDC001985]|uniref:YlxR family protein n=1 Tax=Streptomyces sp. NPDC001985 TaxID=3154406 RepID=UPI00331ED145